MLKSQCTPEEWEVFAAERRRKDASSDAPLEGADALLSRCWTKLKPNPRAREGVKSSRYLG